MVEARPAPSSARGRWQRSARVRIARRRLPLAILREERLVPEQLPHHQPPEVPVEVTDVGPIKVGRIRRRKKEPAGHGGRAEAREEEAAAHEDDVGEVGEGDGEADHCHRRARVRWAGNDRAEQEGRDAVIGRGVDDDGKRQKPQQQHREAPAADNDHDDVDDQQRPHVHPPLAPHLDGHARAKDELHLQPLLFGGVAEAPRAERERKLVHVQDDFVHKVQIGQLVQAGLEVDKVDARHGEGELRRDDHALYLAEGRQPDRGAEAVRVGLGP
mmetsp:Transcript_17799/g.56190  ORF Transcript_17799/g.56190 Transcript_17799/m.56190 type:complete len:272 (+) Transcript_17799:105-920(+)